MPKPELAERQMQLTFDLSEDLESFTLSLGWHLPDGVDVEAKSMWISLLEGVALMLQTQPDYFREYAAEMRLGAALLAELDAGDRPEPETAEEPTFEGNVSVFPGKGRPN